MHFRKPSFSAQNMITPTFIILVWTEGENAYEKDVFSIENILVWTGPQTQCRLWLSTQITNIPFI